MAYVKIVDKSYKDWDAIYNVINYIFRYGDIPIEYVGGYGVIFNNERSYSDDIVEQFQIVKIIYKKENYNLLKHFVITFGKEENITDEDASVIAWNFIKYFQMNYQVVFAVHTDTQNIHVHIVLNTTNILKGNNYSDFYEIEKLNVFLRNIMVNYKILGRQRLAVFEV